MSSRRAAPRSTTRSTATSPMRRRTSSPSTPTTAVPTGGVRHAPVVARRARRLPGRRPFRRAGGPRDRGCGCAAANDKLERRGEHRGGGLASRAAAARNDRRTRPRPDRCRAEHLPYRLHVRRAGQRRRVGHGRPVPLPRHQCRGGPAVREVLHPDTGRRRGDRLRRERSAASRGATVDAAAVRDFQGNENPVGTSLPRR